MDELTTLIKTSMDAAAGPVALPPSVLGGAQRRAQRRSLAVPVGGTVAALAVAGAAVGVSQLGGSTKAPVEAQIVPLASTGPSPSPVAAATPTRTLGALSIGALPDGFAFCTGDDDTTGYKGLDDTDYKKAIFGTDGCKAGTPMLAAYAIHRDEGIVAAPLPLPAGWDGSDTTQVQKRLGQTDQALVVGLGASAAQEQALLDAMALS